MDYRCTLVLSWWVHHTSRCVPTACPQDFPPLHGIKWNSGVWAYPSLSALLIRRNKTSNDLDRVRDNLNLSETSKAYALMLWPLPNYILVGITKSMAMAMANRLIPLLSTINMLSLLYSSMMRLLKFWCSIPMSMLFHPWLFVSLGLDMGVL